MLGNIWHGSILKFFRMEAVDTMSQLSLLCMLSPKLASEGLRPIFIGVMIKT